jgi:REP element-mobilizing transposase RayT
MRQSLSRFLLHLIFSTKNRVSCFTDPGVRKDLHGYPAATANHLGSPAICVGGVADHVHVVCSLGRTLSVRQSSQNGIMSRLTNAIFGIDPRISALWRTDDYIGLVH